ncbi:MAG: dTDP-4-dehydrorhamnose 3,5-epimerase [Acidobacteria bacterium]|nr:dTDP-4-dehydrorhamnose 3,5-epimerase [Acidobacteriota bacterium]
MRVIPASIPDVLLIEPDVFRDNRGFFLETFHAERYAAHGVRGPFVQDNHSRSVQGTVRGLHLQVARPQAKLIRVIVGEIFDVAVDVRVGSPTFGQWVGERLSADSFRQYYIPEGFAHGFSVLSPVAEIEYKCTDLYDAPGQIGLAWNDPVLGIPWGVDNPVLSERDRLNPTIAESLDRLPRYRGTKA